MKYKLLWNEGSKITSKVFDDPDISKILASFGISRFLGNIDSVFLFKEDECIACSEESVYNAMIGLILESHIMKDITNVCTSS